MRARKKMKGVDGGFFKVSGVMCVSEKGLRVLMGLFLFFLFARWFVWKNKKFEFKCDIICESV